MANTRQPKVSSLSEKKRKAELDEGITLTVDGRDYTVRAGDLTALDARALRRETGLSFVGLMNALRTDADIDLIASLVWLSRRIGGESTLTADEVAGEMGYDVVIETKASAPTEVDESDPEA